REAIAAAARGQSTAASGAALTAPADRRPEPSGDSSALRRCAGGEIGGRACARRAARGDIRAPKSAGARPPPWVPSAPSILTGNQPFGGGSAGLPMLCWRRARLGALAT